jgi:prepilin-type N-terminal cleavage/methylation domain-containing protein
MFSRRLESSHEGFTLMEVLISVVITAIIMVSVYGLLQKGQEAAVREPEISALHQSARGGLAMLDRDLTLAGFKTPGPAAILWNPGDGEAPDGITIMYVDPDVPTSRSCVCRRGLPCETINGSTVFYIKLTSFDPASPDPVEAYSEGMTLVAIERSDCNKDGKIGFYPFEISQPPRMGIVGHLSVLTIRHDPSPSRRLLNLPDSFNEEVHPDCGLIGLFRIVQYRVNPLPPTPHPNLERRDVSMGEAWTMVSENVEDLQLQYATGGSEDFMDDPPLPELLDPLTWITGVRVTVSARSDSANLGGSQGEYPEEGIHFRKSFSTTVSLRNMVSQVQEATRGRTYN